MSSEQSAELPSEATAEVRAGCRDVELAWAREQLHVETDGPEGVWQSLQRCGFLPDGAQIAALEILAGTAPLECSPATADYRRLARREALQCEIEAFAGRFFEHSPPERDAVWRDLRERCGEFPGLALRLEQFRIGLSVELLTERALIPAERALIASFMAPPSHRPALRRTLIADLCRESSEKLLNALDDTDVRLDRLAPEFVSAASAAAISGSELKEFAAALASSDGMGIASRQAIYDEGHAEPSRAMADVVSLGGFVFQRWIMLLIFVLSVLLLALRDWIPRRHTYGIPARDAVESPTERESQRSRFAPNSRASRIHEYGIALEKDDRRSRLGLGPRYRVLGPGRVETVDTGELIRMGFDPETSIRRGIERRAQASTSHVPPTPTAGNRDLPEATGREDADD
ncbi:hypothetical protein [Planctellipticum variicoloris]|uniref:hypothetical protein n=1 Tax=Planctellipticum variicoloris TaxID=3064265 RepID=UPI003013DEFC|nr:hypothetical protein SH412_003025 [Planctomycetaceae bacterium SH412]